MNRIWRIYRPLSAMKVHGFSLVMCEDEQCSLWFRYAEPNLINKSTYSLHPEKEQLS